MADEKKLDLVGLAFFQDGKRIGKPDSDNCVVRPLAGGPYVKATGQDVLALLRAEFKGVQFLWLSKPVTDAKPKKGEAAPNG